MLAWDGLASESRFCSRSPEGQSNRNNVLLPRKFPLLNMVLELARLGAPLLCDFLGGFYLVSQALGQVMHHHVFVELLSCAVHLPDDDWAGVGL